MPNAIAYSHIIIRLYSLTNRSAMARCMSIACILVPDLRLRFRMIVSTVMFPTAEITMSILYVTMATTWLSLNFMLGGSDDSSYMDAFVTLSTPGQLTTLGERATTPLVTECNTVVGSESIISMITESAATIWPPRVGGARSAQTFS